MNIILFMALGLSLAFNISFLKVLKDLKKKYAFIEVSPNDRITSDNLN